MREQLGKLIKKVRLEMGNVKDIVENKIRSDFGICYCCSY